MVTSETIDSNLYENNSTSYVEMLTELVLREISKYMSSQKNDDDLIYQHFTKRILKKQFFNFQAYYFLTINKRNIFHSSEKFFQDFKSNYSLQGVDSKYLKRLEANKKEIINLIDGGKLSKLYFTYFYKVKIGYGTKDFGSFFTKLIHHFIPDQYCQVDIPMRNYFKLNHESYFISFLAISGAFKKWSEQNPARIVKLKKKLILDAKKNFAHCNSATNMKILNIIFWSVSNPIKK